MPTAISPLPWRVTRRGARQSIIDAQGKSVVSAGNARSKTTLQSGADCHAIVMSVNEMAAREKYIKELEAIAQKFMESIKYYIRSDNIREDEEGARMKTLSLDMVREVINNEAARMVEQRNRYL